MLVLDSNSDEHNQTLSIDIVTDITMDVWRQVSPRSFMLVVFAFSLVTPFGCLLGMIFSTTVGSRCLVGGGHARKAAPFLMRQCLFFVF